MRNKERVFSVHILHIRSTLHEFGDCGWTGFPGVILYLAPLLCCSGAESGGIHEG